MSAGRDQRVRELFLAAADLPREEQAAYLEQHCAGDTSLRTEVAHLLEDFLVPPTMPAPPSARLVATRRAGFLDRFGQRDDPLVAAAQPRRGGSGSRPYSPRCSETYSASTTAWLCSVSRAL